MSQYKTFESISLSSTIGPQKPRGGSFPESEEDLDPAEFISADSPAAKVSELSENEDSPLLYTTASPTAPKDTSESSAESMLTVRESLDSELSESILQNLSLAMQRPGHDDSILQHVQQEYNQLLAALNTTIAAHKSALNSGSNDLNSIRDTLATQFRQLADNQFYLNELYSQDSTRDTHMCNVLREWDTKRGRILSKIVAIKSDKSEYGKKLAALIDENDEIDAEIAQLEQKISRLTQKKQLLEVEIDNTSSVLESKTSKYVELFNMLEARGKIAILDTLRHDGVSESKVDALVSAVPVKAGFEDNYQRKNLPSAIVAEQPVEESPSNVASPAIGMQPYEANLSSSEPGKPDRILTEPDNAYGKGFLNGQQQSERLKTGFTRLVELVKPKGPPVVRPKKLDDERNTVKQKINLDPILEFLESKSDALSDLSRKAGKQLELYHAFERIWRDLSGILTAQEDELQSVLTKSPDPAKIGEIILSTIDKLSEVVVASRDKDEIAGVSGHLLIVLNNEILSLIRGLHLLPRDYTGEIEAVKRQLLANGILLDEDRKTGAVMKRQGSTERSSASDYLFNISSNAIEHKVLDQVVLDTKEPRPVKTAHNNKSVKGE